MSIEGPQDVDAVLAAHGVNARAVLDRAAACLNLTTDSDLAAKLGVAKTTLSNWRRRNRIPFEHLIAMHFTHDLDFVYCLLGVSAGDFDADRALRERQSVEARQQLQEAFWEGVRRLWPDDYRRHLQMAGKAGPEEPDKGTQ